ncbi:MAG: DUF4431 domain-containing protein [Nitrospinae bacterium]|nr:DUF4431 domain-containing protein [Nitrospinota bacterium]
MKLSLLGWRKQKPLGIITILFIALSWLPPKVSAAEKCLRYDPEVVTLTGTLKREVLPGPPSYESFENGDKPISYWFVYLKKPICVFGNEVEYPNLVPKENISIIELIMDDSRIYKRKRHLLNKIVKIRGTLFPRDFGSQFTEVLIMVTRVEDVTQSK